MERIRQDQVWDLVTVVALLAAGVSTMARWLLPLAFSGYAAVFVSNRVPQLASFYGGTAPLLALLLASSGRTNLGAG